MAELTASVVYRWFYEIAKHRARQYRPNVIHVSEATGCLRKAWYERKYGLSEAHPRFIVYAIGNGVHEALQAYLAGQGWLSEVEAYADLGGFKLAGHADLYHPENSIVVELKTASKTPESPYRSHVMQLNAYLYMLRAKHGYVVYIKKKDGLVRVYRHQWDPELWRLLVERARTLHRAILENKPPRPEPSILCSFCPYALRCYASRGGEEM